MVTRRTRDTKSLKVFVRAETRERLSDYLGDQDEIEVVSAWIDERLDFHGARVPQVVRARRRAPLLSEADRRALRRQIKHYFSFHD